MTLLMLEVLCLLEPIYSLHPSYLLMDHNPDLLMQRGCLDSLQHTTEDVEWVDMLMTPSMFTKKQYVNKKKQQNQLRN